MNTFGIHSINVNTFNLRWHSDYVYPRDARNVLVTFLRVHNLTLNILGYIPGVSLFSGCARMGSGLIMAAVTLSIGDPFGQRGIIIQHWYNEALQTAIAQIARGAFEAFVPSGRIINASIDIITSFFNIRSELPAPSACEGCWLYNVHSPYNDPLYPSLFRLLYLA